MIKRKKEMTIWKKRWAAVLLGLLLSGEARAAMSQLPLTGSTGSVMPNLMFTLDDSGSMLMECVPDAPCIGWSSNYVIVTPFKEVAADREALPLTYDSSTLVARRLRSSAINPIYYNPEVRYLPWLKASGERYPQYAPAEAPIDPNDLSRRANLVAMQLISGRWAKDNHEIQKTTSDNIWPAQYYKLTAGMTGNSIGDFTQVIISPETAAYPRSINRTDCAGSTCTYEEESQNFFNWFTYARNRSKLAKGGTSEAFASVPSGFRVGFGTINTATSRDIDGESTKTILMGVRPFSSLNRENFYNLLQGSSAVGGTPLRRALDDVGKYFSRADSRSPWAADLESGESPSAHQSCRRSFHVLMTDGLWNSNVTGTPSTDQDVDNMDGPSITHADGIKTFQYKPAAPYRGPGDPSLADVAMYYWNRDLREDLQNDVPASDSDPAFWQHLVNHTIGLGIAGKLRNPEDWPGLLDGTKGWGLTNGISDITERADDLWHAAVNSRGRSALANSVSEYASALKSMLESIVASGGREAGVAVSGRSYEETTVKYIPSYKPGDWTGDVEAQRLSDGTSLWSASKVLPASEARNIYTLKQEDSAGVAFAASGMTAATQALLGVDEPGKLIGYVRGDRTEENNSYRKRISVLGDIVNSTPVLVKDLVDSQYDFLASATPGQSSYLRYVKSKKFRAPQLFVGANDGMLHAFNADSGTESFAFVPRTVLGQLKVLANPAYDHRYFVDGPLTEVDIYDNTDIKWRNLVVGTGGAGAKNLFAVNVPVPSVTASGNPKALTAEESAPGADDILWEISSNDADFSDLGHVLQAPEAGILRDGTWVIVTGNGYDSANGRAKLYLINARTGARVAVLDTGAGSPGAPNGLGGVKLVRDSAKRIVAAYAGDLYGNLWKFDVSSSTPSEWRVAFDGYPLFRAANSSGQAEPITAAPAVMAHPLGGLMVLVGSGKLLEADDASSTAERSLYGVWDKVPPGSNTGLATDRVADNDLLVTQTISRLTINDKSGTYFAITSNSVDYGTGNAGKKRGWKIRMSIASGQRLIHAPQGYSGRVIFDTMVPGGIAAGCTATQPQGYTFVIDPFTGAPGRDGPTFDTSGDGDFTAADNVTAGVTWVSSIGNRGIVRVPGGTRVRLEGSAPPGMPRNPGNCKLEEGCTPSQFPSTPVKRQWRQIVTPPSY